MKKLLIFLASLLLLINIYVKFPTPVYAEEEIKFDQTNVLEDLESSENFNIEDYPFDSTGLINSPKIINFVEYCYSYRANMQNNYGLYLYIYNPQNLKINTVSKLNKVELAVGYDSSGIPTTYEKFNLEFLSKSTGDYENLFYKFKIVDHISDDGKTILKRVNSNSRRYDIASIELHEEGQRNATDYGIGGTYTFTGYVAGYGPDVNAESTLKVEVNDLRTIQIEVNSTNYSPDTVSNLGMFHQNTINSVYFSVDNILLEEYGKLQKIKAEWYEYKTKPMAVVKDINVKEALEPFLGKAISNGGRYDENVPYGFCAGKVNNLPTYDYSYNAWTSSLGLISPQPANSYLETLYYIFSSNNADLDKFILTSEELLDYIYSYTLSYDKGTILNSISADLFEDSVDEGRTRGYNLKEIDSNDTFDMLSYDSNHSWWDKLLDYGFWAPETGGDLKNISPIEIVETDALNQDNQVISESLLINENDVNKFKTYYANETAKNKSVILFRFAQTDYYSASGFVMQNGSRISNDDMFLAYETVFLNFDIIELTFNKDGVYTTFAVVSNPIDIARDVTAPLKGFDWLTFILVVILLILLFILLRPVIVAILKIIWKIITSIFNLIAKIFKRGGGSG